MSEGRNLVGVDIGSSSIKVCQLKEGRKGYALIRAGYAALPPQSIVDGHVMNSQAVVEGLGKVFAEAKIKQREIANVKRFANLELESAKALVFNARGDLRTRRLALLAGGGAGFLAFLLILKAIIRRARKD